MFRFCCNSPRPVTPAEHPEAPKEGPLLEVVDDVNFGLIDAGKEVLNLDHIHILSLLEPKSSLFQHRKSQTARLQLYSLPEFLLIHSS
jgi:hypothetical protein